MRTILYSKYYIYLHKIGDHVFYVGSNWKGCNQNRAWERSSRPEKWYDIVFSNGGKYNIEILCYGSNMNEIYKLEMKLIQYFHDIGQADASGEDYRKENNPFYGKSHKEDFKQEQSDRFKERFKGSGNPMYRKGYKLKGEKNGFYGKTHPKEVMDRIKSKLGDNIKAFNKNENLVYSNKKSAYNNFVENGLFNKSYGTWKYKIKQAIENKTELCGYYWEAINNE